MHKTVNYRCPLTEIVIVAPCKLSSCMYATTKTKTGCVGSEFVGEPIIDELEDLKQGATAAKLRESGKLLETVLLLHGYLNACRNKHWSEYPWVRGYKHEPLIQFVSGLGNTFPINVKRLNWNIGLVAASVYEPWWAEYLTQIGAKLEPIEKLSGLSKAKDLIQQFISAEKRTTR